MAIAGRRIARRLAAHPKIKVLDGLPRGPREQVDEDADDVGIYDARKADLAAGGVVLPPGVSAAVLRGDSRLKAVRKWRDKTQQYLEFKTGIGQGYLSDLESGRRTGTSETIAKLAHALNVPMEWLS
jgi:hypothetical protein